MLNFSALTSALFKINDYVEREEKGDLSNKEALNILFRDYELSMSGGNIFKFLKKFIVQPTIFISKDLEGTPYEKDAINAQLNVFSAAYMQAVKIMTDHYRIDSISAINLLKTDRGELGNAIMANGARLVSHLDKSLESDFDANLKRFAGYNVNKRIRRFENDYVEKLVKLENDRKEIEQANINEVVHKVTVALKDIGIKTENDEVYNELKNSGVIENLNSGNVNLFVDELYKLEDDDDIAEIKKAVGKAANSTNKILLDTSKKNNQALQGLGKSIDKHNERLSKEISSLNSFFKTNNKEERSRIISQYTQVERAASDEILEEATKSPTYNFFLRNFDIVVNMTDDKAKALYKVVIPVTIHAHILYVDTETIDSHIASSHSNDDNSIFSQWNDFRIGAKSFWDVAVANTLVKNYRRNLLKDSAGLLGELEQHGKNAKIRLLTTGKAQGFEKYYNLFILSSNTINQLSKKVGDLKNSTNKDKFMEMLGSQQLLVMDYEYELYYFYMLSIDGESKGKLNALNKVDKKKDNDDILAALMQNTIPRI